MLLTCDVRRVHEAGVVTVTPAATMRTTQFDAEDAPGRVAVHPEAVNVPDACWTIATGRGLP
jgi:hypothetical protein